MEQEERKQNTVVHSEIQKVSVICIVAVKEKNVPGPGKRVRTIQDTVKLATFFLQNAERDTGSRTDKRGWEISLSKNSRYTKDMKIVIKMKYGQGL